MWSLWANEDDQKNVSHKDKSTDLLGNLRLCVVRIPFPAVLQWWMSSFPPFALRSQQSLMHEQVNFLAGQRLSSLGFDGVIKISFWLLAQNRGELLAILTLQSRNNDLPVKSNWMIDKEGHVLQKYRRHVAFHQQLLRHDEKWLFMRMSEGKNVLTCHVCLIRTLILFTHTFSKA